MRSGYHKYISGHQLHEKKRSIIQNERGAVSIFLIFVVMIIFTTMSVFIDYARIAALEWRAEVMGQAAARSILSAYDPELQRRYGLFAYGTSDPAILVEQVFNDYQPRGDDTFGWVNMEVYKYSAVVERPIGRIDQFEHQVLEEMKYKAPIQITYELIGKMRPISGAVQEAANITMLIHAVSADYDKRNLELTYALKLQKQARDAVEKSNIPELLGNEAMIGTSALTGNMTTVVDIVRRYNDYKQMILSDAQVVPDERRYEYEIAAYERHANTISMQFRNKVTQISASHGDALDRALIAVSDAKKINAQMQASLARIRAEQNNEAITINQVANADIVDAPANAVSGADAAKLEQINIAVDSLVLADEFFNTYKEELELQKQAILLLNQDAQRVYVQVRAALSGSGSIANVSSTVSVINRMLAKYDRDYVQQASSVVFTREAAINEVKAADASRLQAEQEAGQKLQDANKLLKTLADLSALEEHQRNFQEVGILADSIGTFNQIPISQGQDGMQQSNAPEKAANAAMEQTTDLFKQLGEATVELRDRFYRNEYAYLYFPSYNPLHLQSFFKTGNAPTEMMQTLGLANQELEYMMYGFRNPASNLASAFGEIFAARFAVRTMEGLVERAGLIHPLAIMAGAIVYGVTMALADLLDLVTTNSIPLSKYAPTITLSYSDYLRLFMMMHGDREEMSIRMLALIQHNTGTDPMTRGTYAVLDFEPRIKLWFLPGLIKALGQTGLLEGRITNGYYEVAKRSAYAY